MRILIVGATGFVGGHLLAECRARGDVLAGTYRPGEDVAASGEVEWHAADVLDTAMLEHAVRAARPEGIVHLAGQANVALGNRDPVTTFRVNAEGTVRVLDTVERLAPDARLLVITSAEVYGATEPEAMPVSEDAELRPRTPYGVSKAAADLAAAQAGLSGRSARMLAGLIDLFACTPEAGKLKSCSLNEAFCTGIPGATYAVFFPDGGDVLLEVVEASAGTSVEIRWLDICRNAWHSPVAGKFGTHSRLRLVTPEEEGYWACVVTLRIIR